MCVCESECVWGGGIMVVGIIWNQTFPSMHMHTHKLYTERNTIYTVFRSFNTNWSPCRKGRAMEKLVRFRHFCQLIVPSFGGFP